MKSFLTFPRRQILLLPSPPQSQSIPKWLWVATWDDTAMYVGWPLRGGRGITKKFRKP